MKNKLGNPAIFQFNAVNSEDWEFVWEDNIVKFICKDGNAEKCKNGLAKVIDIDYSEFEAREINFKTPSEHTING